MDLLTGGSCSSGSLCGDCCTSGAAAMIGCGAISLTGSGTAGANAGVTGTKQRGTTGNVPAASGPLVV